MAQPSHDKVLRQLSELQNRLTEAEGTLDAIRSGSVDALIVHTPRGEQLFTLKGADQTYRTLVESMNEGAATLKQGVIAYCNRRFAGMAGARLESILGGSIFDLIKAPEFAALVRRVEKGHRAQGSMEAVLRARNGTSVPVLVAASRFRSDGRAAVCLVITDITARKESERVRQELSRSILNAQEQERQRVARDLHDSVNQLLSSARYRLSSLVPNHNPRAGQKAVRQARVLVERAITEVRLISRNLRPSELDDLGLLPAMRSLAHDFQERSGIRTRFKGESASGPLATELEMALYRIAQEAVNNVEKHSRATRAELSLSFTPERAVLTVRDNGRGFASPVRGRTGWGLQNMRERAALLNGTFVVKSVPGKGTRLYVQIPLAPRGAKRSL